MSWSGWLLLGGVVLIVAGFILVEAALDNGLTGAEDEAGRARLGNIGCIAGLLGLLLIIAWVAGLAFEAVKWMLS